MSQYANLNLTWKSLYVTQPVSEGNSWLQFRVEYAWGSPNKTNRTIKLYTRLWLDKSKYYLQVDNTSANRSNQLRGINVGINIRGNTKGKTYKVNDYGHSPRCQLVDNNNNDNYSPYIVRCKSIWETYDNTVQWTRTDALMCELDYELSYDDNGSASGTILYDLYLRWKDIDTYGIHCLDARGSYNVINAPKIDPKYITNFSAETKSKNIIIKPNRVYFPNTPNTTIELGKYETHQEIAKSASIGGYTSSIIDITIKGTPDTATGELIVESSDKSIIDLPGPSIDGVSTLSQIKIKYPSQKKFSVIAKKPGKATISIEYKKKNITKSIEFTISADNGITWSVDKSNLISVTKPASYAADTRKISPKSGTNGTAIVTAKSNSNSSAKATLTINSHLAPNALQLTTDKNSIYPGETIKITTTLKPYNKSNVSESISSRYADSNCYVIANNSDTGTILASYINYKTNPYVINYTLPANTTVKNSSITIAFKPQYSEDSVIKKIPVNTPTISATPTSLSLTAGESKTFIVTTVPSDSGFTVSSSNKNISTKINGNKVTVTGNIVGETTITVKSNAKLLAGMSIPKVTINVKVIAKKLTYLNLVAYSTEYNKLKNYTKILKATSFTVSPTSVELTNKNGSADSKQITLTPTYNQESAIDLLLDGEPGSGCAYDITVKSSDPSVADLNFWEWDKDGKKININKLVCNGTKKASDGTDISDVDAALTIVYKKEGTTKITATDAISGLSSSVNLTVKKDGSVTWTSADTKLVTVNSTGKITAKTGVNGSTTVTAKMGSCSKKIAVDNHLLPSGIDISLDKTSHYKFTEKPKFTVQILPNTGSASTSVTKATKYVSSNYTLTAVDIDKIVAQGSNNNTKYSYNGYALKNTDLTSKYKFNVTLGDLSASKIVEVDSEIQSFDIKDKNISLSLAPLSIRLSTISSESVATYEEVGNMNNRNRTLKSNSSGNFWTTMFFTSVQHTIPIKWKPTKVVDEFTVESNNTNVIRSFNTDGVFSSDPISATTRNGSFNLTFWAYSPGKARITVKSVNNPKVKAYIDCTVTENREIIIENSNKNIVDSLTKVEDKSGIQKWSYHTSSKFNGMSTITAKSKANTSKAISLTIKNLLTPTEMYIKLHNQSGNIFDKSDNAVEAYVGDKIDYILGERPSSGSESSTVASNYRYADYHITTKVKNQNITITRALRSSGLYTTLKYSGGQVQSPTLTYEVGPATGKTIIIDTTAVSSGIPSDPNLERFESTTNTATITIIDPTLEIGLDTKNFSNSQTIILSTSTSPKSKQNVYVKTVPTTANFECKPTSNSTITEGYVVIPKTDKSGNKVLEFTGNRRNIDIDSKLTLDYSSNPQSNNNIKFNELKIEYNGIKRAELQNPFATVRIYTGEHFGYPKILNSVVINNSNHLYYYGNSPKIIIELPRQNDFSFLKNIEIKLSNDKIYSMSKTNQYNYFSIYYNKKCSPSDIINDDASKFINSAIFDYDGYNYCVFSPSESDIRGCTSLTVTFKSYMSTVPDTSTNVTLHELNTLQLPKVGDPIALAPIQDYLTAISTIVKPYLTNGLVDGKQYTLSNFFYGLSIGVDGVLSTDALGKKAKKNDSSYNEFNNIRALPFFKLLFGLNRILFRLQDITTYGNQFKGRLTTSRADMFNFLTCKPVRNMFVNNKMVKDWYETYVLESSKQFNESDKRLYENFLDLYGIELNSSISLTDNTYPIMVDDSRKTMGENRLPNTYKDSIMYDDFTISPLREIIKALEQL